MQSLIDLASPKLIKTYVVVAVLAIAASLLFMPLFSKKLDVRGKHVYITGGSSGFGLALAEKLIRLGAHVTIVARDQRKLDEAAARLQGIKNDSSQKVQVISADLTAASSSNAALQQAVNAFGGVAPDWVILSAGFSKPQLFLDTSEEDLKKGLDGVYWVSAWTAHAATRLMAQQRRKDCRIVFVSSFLGFTTFAGYTSYSPAKYALRGLADALRSELLLYGIKVHLYVPAGILTPGYETENLTKPKITRKIEEDDTPISAEACTDILLNGLSKGHYQITNDLITDLVRLQSKGAVPANNVVMDFLYWVIGGIGLPIWRIMTDRSIKSMRKEYETEWEASGFYSTAK